MSDLSESKKKEFDLYYGSLKRDTVNAILNYINLVPNSINKY